jgi:hypothetical protein
VRIQYKCCGFHLSIPRNTTVQPPYFQNRIIGNVLSPNSYTHISARDLYIFPGSSCWSKYVDRYWEYVNRSQTHECENWDWGRAIPRKGIHEWDCRCSVVGLFQHIALKRINAQSTCGTRMTSIFFNLQITYLSPQIVDKSTNWYFELCSNCGGPATGGAFRIPCNQKKKDYYTKENGSEAWDMSYLFISLIPYDQQESVHCTPMRPTARGLAQHGFPPGWLEERDPAGMIFYVMDGPYRLPFPYRTGCPDMSFPAVSWWNFQLLLYINVHNHDPPWATSRKEGLTWYSSRHSGVHTVSSW